MNGVELLDILLKAQYEGNLEKMRVYFNDEEQNLNGVFFAEIDKEGDLVLNAYQ